MQINNPSNYGYNYVKIIKIDNNLKFSLLLIQFFFVLPGGVFRVARSKMSADATYLDYDRCKHCYGMLLIDLIWKSAIKLNHEVKCYCKSLLIQNVAYG